MYQTIYDLVVQVLYNTTTITGWQEMFVTIISSCAVLFAFAVPFVIVWKVIKMLCRG